MIVPFKRLHPDAIVPTYATDGSAGMDLYAFWARHPLMNSRALIEPGELRLFGTGIAVDIAHGYEGQVRLRSSVGKESIVIPNGVGTIDSDYRGEIKIMMLNLSREPFCVLHGHRYAQLVIAPVVRVEMVEVEELSGTSRGQGGFGSTGR